MIDVPAVFATAAVNRAGQSGKEWVDSLPALVESLCARWGLAVDGTPLHGHLGLVVPVRRGEEPCALKVSWQDATTLHEALALAAWDGQGTVLLLDHEPATGSLLLERLDAGRTLSDIDADEAVTAAGLLLRRLSVPAPQGFACLRDLAAGLPARLNLQWEQLGRPFSRRLVDAAAGLAAEYGPTTAGQLVNGDLHYENVLAGYREPWLAIDPKPLTGDPEYAVAPLLWRRFADMEGLPASEPAWPPLPRWPTSMPTGYAPGRWCARWTTGCGPWGSASPRIRRCVGPSPVLSSPPSGDQ